MSRLFSPLGRRIICSLVLAGMVPVTLSSCYGSFPLTMAVYRANGRVTEHKLVHSIIMWILIIIPVYGVCMFVDFIILNLVEFWSGDKIDISQTYEIEDGSTVAMQTSPDGETLTMTVSKDGAVQSTRNFIRLGDGRTGIYGADKAVRIGMVTPRTEGGFLIEDYLTGQSQVMSGNDIEAIREAVMSREEAPMAL